VVFAHILDFDKYPNWCPFTEEMKTTSGTPVSVGSVIIEQVRLSPADKSRRETRVNVTELNQSDCHIAWINVLIHPWLLLARRTQRVSSAIDAEGRHGSLYETEDSMSGCLSPLVSLLYGEKVRNGLQAVADALASRFCESVRG